MGMCFRSEAGGALDLGDGGFTGDKIVGDRKIWALMKGSFVVQGGEKTAGAKEKSDPANGRVGEPLVPEEKLLLRRGEVGVGGVEDVGLRCEGSEVGGGGGERAVDAARGGEVGRKGGGEHGKDRQAAATGVGCEE